MTNFTLTSPSIYVTAKQPSALLVNLPAYEFIVADGYIPRWIKELIGVVMLTFAENNDIQQQYITLLRASGLHGVWLEGLSEKEISNDSFPDEVQAIIQFASMMAEYKLLPCQDNTDGLRAADLSDAEILEVAATVQLFSCMSMYTAHSPCFA